ncbi:MAG: SpoIID/LytB domain-containing protein [Deltaproteobacteria bacterium]|nr:SpoIID/LytB domain-containing protein [Deltaproteobacteria bacterium]
MPEVLVKGKRLLAVFMLVTLSGCVRINSGQAAYGGKLRVLVVKGASLITVKGSSAGNTLKVGRFRPGRALVDGKYKALPIRFFPKGEAVYLNNKSYRGVIEIYDEGKGLMIVNELSVEAYLAGIVSNEIPAGWPEDALKAQAVIARTYALYHKKKRLNDKYHIEGSVLGQVFGGMASENPATTRAVDDTKGEIVAYNREPALTVYHSNAGGRTDRALDVWSSDYPYLVSVESPYDSASPGLNWEFAVQAGSFMTLLNASGYSLTEPEGIYAESKTPSGRIKTLIVKDEKSGSVRLSGEDLRRLLGYSSLKSSIYKVSKTNGLFIFTGKGSGHGVGLSQWGAKGMAENGYSYKKILMHYYPGTSIIKAY